MMKMHRVVAFAVSLTLFTAAQAEPAAADGSAAKDVAGWVKDLDSDDFNARQQATEKLIKAGQAAVGPVTAAAQSESLEVTSRCIQVLSRLLESKDEAAKAAARKGLELLAKSENKSAASRAANVLNPQKPAPPDPAPRPFGPRIQIRGIQIGGGGVRIQVKNVNGHKTIEAEENGKKVKIEVEPGGKIKMEVTEKIDGKEKTSKYEAKDADELKKKHPDAHKLYEKYSKGRGARAVIQIGGLGRAILPRRVPQKVLEEMKVAREKIEKAAAELRKLAEDSKITPDDVKKLVDKIDAARKELEAAEKKLRP